LGSGKLLRDEDEGAIAARRAAERMDEIRERVGPIDVQTYELVQEGRQGGLIPADQAWFWTEEWQEGERKAEADIKEGRVKRFHTGDESLGYLRSRRKGQ